jgi:hypothetical protein
LIPEVLRFAIARQNGDYVETLLKVRFLLAQPHDFASVLQAFHLVVLQKAWAQRSDHVCLGQCDALAPCLPEGECYRSVFLKF